MEPPRFPDAPLPTVRAAPGAPACLCLPLPAGTPPFRYTWSRADASLDGRFAVSDDAGGVRLTISSAQTTDTGVYTLQATNASGAATARARLEVSPDEAPSGTDPPTFLRRLQDLTVRVGTRTRLLVEILSDTHCKVTWYRNERRLLEAERVSLVKDGNFWCADVAAVSVDDAGRWTCTAENAGGRASCSAHLNVLVPKAYKRPEFVEELRAILTEQGTVSLECKVVGVPTPVLRWFKDSREIKAGDVFALTANAEDPTSLGTYTCEAVNCMGRAYSSSKVHVMGRAGDGSRPASSLSLDPPPIFTTELAQQHAKICEPLTLAVQLVVPPWPRSVVWYNKEGKIENGDRYHVLEDGVGGYMLEIPSAEYPDEGEWKCVATTSGGRVGISSCYVTMDVPKNYRKPRFMENLQAVLTEEGLVSFECKVVGFPTPVLSWFKDGQELKPGDVYQLTGTNSLGSYCCIARNCMGQARSSAELTVEDIQNQLNEEEKLHLFSKNQAPNFITGLKSVEAKIDEPFRFTVKVAIPPEPSVLWYRDDQPVDESSRNHLGTEEKGIFFLDIQNLEFLDQAEWKCVAMNDFGHSVTSCFLKLIIPRHYKKPRFLENLQAILSEEGAVNLECKVIGVPQPVLKWYKDGEELKSGDIHRIISGQDGTCCLGTYTCEAQNCMGIAASSASLLGFEDSMKAKAKKLEEQALQRNLSLSTIHEERTSQMYDTPVGDITLDEKGEISFSFDGKEVSVSLYETPDLTEEEALQIVEMYADQLSENVTEHNVVELPPLRFVKETSTSGNLLMEAIIIDVSPEYFASTEEDLRTEADVEDISIADENGPPQLSLDTDIGGEDYLEKTMALLSDEKSDLPKKSLRKKSDSQRSVEDYFSLSRDQSFSEEKRDDDTQVISETELMSFASARSSTKQKSRTSKQSFEEAHDLAETPKPMEFKEESQKRPLESDSPVTPRPKRERRTSRSSRRSSSGSEKSFSKLKAEEAREQITAIESLAKESMQLPTITDEEFRNKTTLMSTLLSKVINDVQIVERDIILKSELMLSAATASRSLEIISNLITPLSEIQSVSDAIKDLAADVKDLSSSMFNRLPPSLKNLQQSLAMIEKCIEVESDSKTLVKKTCVAFIETCGEDMQQLLKEIKSITKTRYLNLDEKAVSEIEMLAGEMTTVLKLSADTIKTKQLLSEASEIKIDEPTFEAKHLRDTQKAVFELRSPVNSLLCIAESAETGKIIDVSKVKTSDIIMNDMSASIQDLQTALEQIESLSVKESTTALHKYNTEIIETVMESVLKLRSSFELLSTETRTEENKDVLKQTLTSIKQNLSEISSHIDTIEKNVGPLDILQSDNKLEVLQKMAQILIALENNLPNFETLPEIKNHMDIFHKNLTKVLENVIESNDGKKYFALLQICDAVNRLNTSIKTIDTDILLSLASLSNTVKIIQDHIISNVFQSELNCAMLSNIADILVGIQEAINHAEEISINVDSEHLQDLSIKEFEINKANVIVEHINQTICAITNVKSMEATAELKTAIAPTLESICPILEELKRYVATSRVEKTEMEHVSAMSDFSMAETLAAPLCELNQNIIILNQMIMENIEHIKDSGEIVSTIAEPLHELHITLEVLQQDVISQYGEELTPYEVSVNIASAVQNLQSCILMIQDQAGIEGIDEMSTLEDVSGLKTTADTIPEEFLFASSVAETPVEQGLVSMDESLPLSETAQELNILNEHLTILKTPEILDALDTLSEVSDYSSLKSVAVGLGELYSGIEEILQPIVMESSTELSNLINPSKLTSIAVPMQELQQYLSVLDINNIPIYEHILEMPIEKIHSVFQSITQFKVQLEKCLQVIFPGMENADKDVGTVHKVECLREVCENMKETIESTTLANEHKETLESLGTCVQNLLQATETSNELKMEKVKCIAQELYDKIQNAEEDMIQFTPMTPEKLAQEAKLFQSVSEVEKNIAVLEQFDFVDVSKVSDITPCTTPQLAMELEVDSLLQIDDVVENAVNVLQNSVKEMPVADLMIVEDFFKTCKNEFTILRCLVAKPVSHKKLIRILQEFTNIQISINDFKIKCLDLNLTEEIKNNLVTFMIHADDCLKNVQESLIRIIDSQSELLFKKPAVKLDNNIKKLQASIKEEKEFVVKNIVEHFIALSEIAIISVENIDRVIKDELTNPNSIQTKPEERKLVQYVEDLEIFLENEIRSQSVDSPNKQMLSELLDCLHKHQDYKDAIGSGKSLIIIKCLAECSEILQLKVLKSTLTQETVEEMEIKEGILKTILTEMLAPLQAFQSQIKNIQQKIVSDPHDESASLDISTTESFVHTMTEIHKEIAQIEQNISEGSAVNNEDISLLMEVDKEIHTIQDSIKAIDNTPSAEKVREISKPIEDIEKTLHSILSSELARTESKDKLVTAESADLSQVLEKYVSPEIVQALEEISTVIEVNELKQSIELARELKDNIATINSETKSEIIEKAINTQIILEQELQNALSVVQVQAIQNTEKLCNVVDAIELKKVNDVVAELQAEVSYAIMISPELKISNAADEHLEISPADIIPEASTQVFEEVKSETNLICDLEVETSKKESVETTTVTQEGEIAEVVETVALTEDITEQHITPETVAVIQEIEPVIVEEVVSSMMPVLKSEDINENVEVPARPIAENIPNIEDTSKSDTLINQQASNSEIETRSMQSLDNLAESEATVEYTDTVKQSMETLQKHLQNYTSDITQLLTEACDESNMKEIKQSLKFAQELYSENVIGESLQMLSFPNLTVAQKLYTALSVVLNQLSESVQCLPRHIGINNVQIIKADAVQLIDSLASIITPVQSVECQQLSENMNKTVIPPIENIQQKPEIAISNLKTAQSVDNSLNFDICENNEENLIHEKAAPASVEVFEADDNHSAILLGKSEIEYINPIEIDTFHDQISDLIEPQYETTINTSDEIKNDLIVQSDKNEFGVSVDHQNNLINNVEQISSQNLQEYSDQNENISSVENLQECSHKNEFPVDINIGEICTKPIDELETRFDKLKETQSTEAGNKTDDFTKIENASVEIEERQLPAHLILEDSKLHELSYEKDETAELIESNEKSVEAESINNVTKQIILLPEQELSSLTAANEIITDTLSDKKLPMSSVDKSPVFTTEEDNDIINENTTLNCTIETTEKCDTLKTEEVMDKSIVTLLQHIDDFVSSEITDVVDELSKTVQDKQITETFAIARELREKIEASEIINVSELNGELSESLKVAQAQQEALAQQLQSSLEVLQEYALNSADEIISSVSLDSLKKVSDAVIHLQDDLISANIVQIKQEFMPLQSLPDKSEDTASVQSEGENTIQRLDGLLQEVSDKIDLSSTDKNSENTESLRDSLDEVQTVIIKLRRDYDGIENESLNETLEDLECSVRSVQLQINEDSPPELLKEACATLQLLVNNIHETQEVQFIETLTKGVNKTDKMLEKCSDETQETVDLLETATVLDVKDSSQLGNIISNINFLRETLKSLRLSFLGNAESLIEKGIEVNLNLEQIEEKVFSLEKDLASEESIKTETKERINSAIHAIFGSISNMRSTILSIQKQYMYENYGKPSENLLKSVKIVSNFGKTEDNVELKRKWKNLSVSLRNVIIHFEDIKFYVNLDKTARIPSDSGLTKCVLDELKSNITEAIRPLTKCIEENTIEKIDHLIHCLATNILNIDSRSTLEVKEKIPIFKNIASQILDVTETLQNELQSLKEKGVPLVESTNISELDKTDTINNTQQSSTLDINESNASVENLSSDMVKAETTDIDKDTEDLLCISSDTKDLTVFEKETKTPSDATLGHSESKLIKAEESITNDKDENYLSQANDEKEGIKEVPQVEDVIQKLEKLESVPSTSKVLESVIDSNIKEITNVNDESIMTDIETSLLTTEEQSNIGEIKSDEIADMEKVPPAEVTIQKSESVPSTSKILETDVESDIKEITNVKDENNMADLETTLNTGEIKNDEIVGIEKVSEAEVTGEKIEKSEPVLSTSQILETDIESDINEIKNEKDEKNMVDLKTSLLTIEEQSNIGDIKNDETAGMEKTSQAEDAMVKLEKTESVPTSSKILETDIEINSKELNINVKHENNMADLETSLLTREDQSNIGEEKNDLEKSISIIIDDNAPSDKPVEVLPSTSKITEVPVSVIKSDMLSIDPKLTESINEDLESEPAKKEQSELIEEEKREFHTEQANKELSEPIEIVLNEHTNVALAGDIVPSSSQLSEENMKSSNIDEEQRFGVIESETNERILRTDDKKVEIGEESINETIIKTEADVVVEPNKETMILKTEEKEDVHETKIEKSENGDAISITSEPEIDNLPEKEKIPIILEKELTPRDMKCIDEIESIPSTSKDHQKTTLEVAEIKEESTESTENVIVHEQNKLESSLNFTENAEKVQELGLEKNEETKTDVITEHKNVSPLMDTGKKIESQLTSEVLSGTEEITHSEGEVLIDREDKVISDDDTAVVKQQILQSKGIENERNTDKVQEETSLLTNTTQPDTVTIVDLASEKENYGTSVISTTELTAKEKENDDTLLTQVSSNISDSDQEAKYLMLGDEHELVIENVSASITEDDKGKYTEMVKESQLVLEPIINEAIPSASTENQLEKNIQASDKPAFNEDKLKIQEDLHLSSTTASEITTEKGTQVAEKDIILTLADTVSTENVSIFPSISKKSAKKQKESSSSVKVKSAESDSSKIISTSEDKPTDIIEKTISKEEIQIDIVEKNENTSKPLDVLEITNKIKMETPSNMLQAKTEVISTTDEYMVQETVSEMKISDGSVKEVINPQLEQCELMSAVEKSTLKFENIDKEPCTSKILEETSLSCTYVDAVSSEVDIKTNDNMIQETEKTQAELKRDKSDLVLEESETTSTVSGDIHKVSMEDIEKPNVIESLPSTTKSIVNDSVQLDADLNIQNDVSDSNKKSVKELKSKKKRKDPLEISDSDSKSAKENELIYSSDKKEGEEPTIKRESMAEAGEKVLSTEEKNIIFDSKITDEKCLQQDMTQQQEKKLPHTETKRMDDEQSKQNREEIIAQDERKEMKSSTPQEKLHQSTGDLNSKQKNIEKNAQHELKEDDVLVGQEKIYQDGNQKDLELRNMDDEKYEQDNKGAKPEPKENDVLVGQEKIFQDGNKKDLELQNKDDENYEQANKGAKPVSMDQNADLTRLDDDLTLKQENEKIEKRLKEMEEFEKKQKESKLQEKKEKAAKKAARIEELQRKKKEELQKKDEAQLQEQKDLELKQIEEQKEQLQKAAVLVDKEEDEKQTSVIKKEFVNKEKHEEELNEIEQKQNLKLSLNESIKHQPLQKEAELSQLENKTHTLASKSIESTDNLDTKMTHKSIENTSSVQPKDVQSKIEIEKDEERTSSKKRDEITKDNNHQDNIILKSRKEIQDTSMTDRKSKEESEITSKAVVKNGHQDTKGKKIEEQINRNLEKSVSKKEVIQEKKQVLENQVKPRSQDQMYKKQATSDNYHDDSVTKQNESESRLDSTHNGVYSKHSTHRTETRHRTDKTSHDQSHIESHIKTERISVDQKRIAKDEISHTSGRRRPTDEKERPKFVDHSHRDYTMEFARPSGYRERLTETSCLGSDTTAFDRRSAGTPIYKVTSLVQEAQLRSSLPPSPVFRRSAEPSEVKPEVRHRTKAASEARSILTEKRSGTRDSKRKPVFSTHLTDRTAVEGSRVKLTCSILSSSDPKVTWFQNGVVITNKLKYKTKITEGLITLEVLNAVPSDSAEYCCTAENENGSVSTSANLKVYPSFEASPIPPTFTRSIRDTYHLAENELVLECRIRGQPLPTISWLKDDKKIENNERYQSYYLADGVCRLAICCPTTQDSGKYTCKAENSVWSDQITHVVNFTGRERLLSPNITTVERSRFSRQGMEFRRPHFANVLSDHTVSKGGTIGLQVEIRGDPSKVEWLREGRPVTEQYRNASAFVEHGLYTLALTDVTEKESGTYTCRAWSSHGTVDMNAAITVVQPSDIDGKPAIIAGRPEKDILISVGEDVNISFRVQGEPKPKVVFMKGTRDITNSQRVCKMTSDDYVKFTLKRSVVSDAGTYCVLARNAYGCDRAFVTVVVRQRASSDNLISDWTYPLDESSVSYSDKGYKSVPDRIPGEPTVVEGGNNWLSLTWPKPDPQEAAPVLAYKVEGWLLGKEGGARWAELGITPLNSYDVFNLKQGEEYHFRVTPKNRNGWGEPSQTTNPIAVGLGGERPEFPEALPGQHKVLVGQKAELACSVIGKPTPEIVWMKNGHELEEEAGRVKTSFNGHNCVLSIHEIRPDDDGHYSCEATNEHGRASTYARVAVVTDRVIWEADVKLKRERSSSSGDGEYPPQFTMRLRDRRVQATYPVRLTCQVVGKPPPAVTWFKDGEEVPRDGRHTRSQDELFHTLEIERTCLEDGGVYEAMARNSRGAVSCHCSLVVDKGIRAYVAPEFCCGLDPAYRAHEGEELRVAAVVEAYPSVGIVWYREGVRLRPSRRAVMTLDRDGMVELAIACITPKDAGVYSCTASNEVGTATTSTRVEVIADGSVREEKVTPPALISPDVPYSTEPMFIRKPRSSEAREGDTVIIGCEVIGDPKPDVYWLRDFLKPDYYRDAIHFKRVGDGPEYRLEIPHAKLDYTGAYSVVATNVHGEAKAIISLQILAKDPDCADDAHSVRYGRMDVIPQIKRELQDLLCCDGDTVEFECQFDGQPEPEIKWYRYSELIRDSDMHCQYFDGSTARLRIRNVTPDDEGMYTCNASNNLGSTNSTACLVVYPPGEPNMMSLRLQRPANLSAVSTPRSTPRQTPSRSESMTPIRVLGPQPTHSQVMPMPPKFITVLNNKLVTEGQDVEFHCTVWGHPAPWVSWDKDGSKLSNSFRIRLKEKNDVKILQIDNAVPEDAGMYRITIENEHGMLQSYARLDVMTTTGKYIVGVNRTSAASSSKMTTKKSTVRQTDFSKWTSGQKNYSHSGPTDETENVDGALDLSMPTSERNNTENTFVEHSKSKCVNQHLVCHPYCPPNVPSSRNPSSCLAQDSQLAAAVMGIQGPVVTVETQTSFKVPNPVKQMPKWPRMRVVKLPHKSTQQDQVATRLKPKLPHQKIQRQITEANELEVEQVTMYGFNGNWASNSINMWDVLQKLNYIG